VRGKWERGIEPRNFAWVIRDQMAVCERPGGYARNHRKVRRHEEILWLRNQGFTRIVSLLPSPHNLTAYDEVGVPWSHFPFGASADAKSSLTELYTAIRGKGARRNGEPITVSPQQDLSQALVATGFSYDSRIRRAQAEVVLRLLPEVRDIRRAGSAALDLAWCACGRVDAFFEADMHVWDRGAGELLISEAGGVITPLLPPLGDGRGVVAANQSLHDVLRALVLGDSL